MNNATLTKQCLVSVNIWGRVDDGQTNSVLFDLCICLAVESYSERATADSRQVDDGQTNSVLFGLSVWPSSAVQSEWTSDGVDDGQTNFVLFD